MQLEIITAVVFGVLVISSGAVTLTDDIPQEVIECVQMITEKRNVSAVLYVTSTESIQTFCLQQFIWNFGNIKWSDFNITEKDQAFVNSLVGSLVYGSRQKRQTGPEFPQTGFRIRREYRRLSDAERTTFHNTLRQMKQSGQYDTFANMHSGVNVNSAHNGPNFPGWHRVYLSLFEEAMRRVTPGVSLPYWDSTLDFDMTNPANSIIWSAAFLGNGNGQVITGPFANWMTNSLQLLRNVGGGSTLISKEVVARILTRCRNSQIWAPTATSLYDFEFYHGGPHVWVGGQMAFVNSAAHDPVFFMLHAYIDYVWELFRARQTSTSCRVNPETDYPATTNNLHASQRVMDGFPQYRNIDGYRNYWTQNWYRYESSPTCTSTQPSCGSPYLRCDTRRQRCVSIERSAASAAASLDLAVASAALEPTTSAEEARTLEARIQAGPKFRAPEAEPRTQVAQMAAVALNTPY